MTGLQLGPREKKQLSRSSLQERLASLLTPGRGSGPCSAPPVFCRCHLWHPRRDNLLPGNRPHSQEGSSPGPRTTNANSAPCRPHKQLQPQEFPRAPSRNKAQEKGKGRESSWSWSLEIGNDSREVDFHVFAARGYWA